MSNPRPERTGTRTRAPSIADLAIQRERERQILELALRGRNGVQIAAELDIDKSTVTRTLQRIWERNPEAPRVAELRAKWDARIEAALDAIWDKLLVGEVAAVNAFVRLAERAAKMWALDQQASKDAGALAEALLADPTARAQRAQELRDDLARKRAEREAQEPGETG